MGLNNASSEAQTAQTGGWLDAVTYQAGLSGGSWATGTTVINNYSLPTDLIDNVRLTPTRCLGGDIWQVGKPIRRHGK